jgi:hypothetical protein
MGGETIVGSDEIMEEISIPTTSEILEMSSIRCLEERLRLKNEISFARGDETTGGPSNKDKIAAYRAAIESIELRIESLASREAA